jgi:hypothetical protein
MTIAIGHHDVDPLLVSAWAPRPQHLDAGGIALLRSVREGHSACD